jgi:ABC-2 type transport system ATP-binding protein
MIEVRKLTKIYGETLAVDRISFDVPEGEVLGFLGPNGAGKSTTMRVLTGFTPPTSGEATVAGLDVHKQSREVRALLGYLPEGAPVYGEMTVRDFVRYFVTIKGFYGEARRKAVDAAIEECGLKDVASRLLRNLSKGYRQRAALAQAIAGDPKVVILDEPTVGLDPAQVSAVRELIHSMAKRRTVILSTHILPEVARTCTRVVIINRGRVVAAGTPEHLTDPNEGDHMIVNILGRVEQVEAILREQRNIRHARLAPGPDGTVAIDLISAPKCDVRGALARAIIEAGMELQELHRQGQSLEEFFLRVVSTDNSAREVEPHAS